MCTKEGGLSMAGFSIFIRDENGCNVRSIGLVVEATVRRTLSPIEVRTNSLLRSEDGNKMSGYVSFRDRADC
jgi:hypothetical protein